MKSSKELVNKLVKETLEQKYTNAPSSWNDLIEELSKEIKKPKLRAVCKSCVKKGKGLHNNYSKVTGKKK